MPFDLLKLVERPLIDQKIDGESLLVEMPWPSDPVLGRYVSMSDLSGAEGFTSEYGGHF